MSKVEVFRRKASGLVRQASWFDGFLTSIGTMNMIWLAVSFIWALSLFPGAEFHISIIIATVFCLFNALLFSQFATMMPRSGGDYVFNTRGLSPGVGFIVNFSMVVWNLFWTAYTCYLLSAVSASSAFTIIGEVTGTQWLIDLGTAAAQPEIAFIIGTLVILIIGLITYFGIKTFFRFMKVAFAIGMIGVVVLIGVLLASSHETFVNVFNSYAGPGVYARTLTDATQNGWVAGTSFDATILAVAVAFQPLGFSIWSSYISGEIKDAKRFKVNALAIVGSLVTMCVFMLILWSLSTTVFGYDFMGAVGYLFYNVPEASALAIPPGTHFFGSLLAQNLLTAVIIGVGFIAWAFLYAPQSMLMVVRCMLAWSMERLAPKKLGEVNPKHNTPTWAIIVATIISIIFLGFFILTIYAFVPFDVFSIYGFNAFLGGGTLTFMAVALSGIVFSYRKTTKKIFESSPANQRVAGIPLLAINGIITLVFMGFITYLYLSLPEFGVATAASLGFIIGVYVLGAVWYIVARAYQKRKGVPIELAFKEIPPE
ncbi:MAG: APC family permease [Candidatus Bathyarchaeota archaeon]|nr:APC family permease [Candidatus Bathyarchaeota archaeon]